MRLRILMVAPQPFFRPRGTPFSVLHRIRALALQGHRITLVTYPFGEDVAMDGVDIVRASRPPMVRDVKIGPSVAKLALDVPVFLETRRLLRTQEFDVIHSHEEAAFFCVGLSRKHAVPHIYDMHSSLPQQLENFGRFRLKPIEAVFRWQENRVLDSCDGVITICEDLARVVEARGVKSPHAMIENTGDDSCVFPGNRRDVRAELGIGDRDIVLYTGTFESYQGLDMLRDALPGVIRRRPETHLVLVGGTEPQVDAFREMVSSMGLADHVTLVGTVHPSEVGSFLESAQVIVSPRSSGTNTPLKIYGYMRSGVPIVATDRMTHTQTLNADTAFLVEPTAEGLASGIIDALEDPAKAARVASSARSYIDRHYSDSDYVSKVVELYERVVGDASPRQDRNLGVSI